MRRHPYLSIVLPFDCVGWGNDRDTDRGFPNQDSDEDDYPRIVAGECFASAVTSTAPNRSSITRFRRIAPSCATSSL